MSFKKKNKSYIEHKSSKQLCNPRGTGKAQKPVLLQLPPQAPTFPFRTYATQPRLVGLVSVRSCPSQAPPLLALPISQAAPLAALPIFSGPAPARLLPQVPKPYEGRQGSLRLPLHFLRPFPPYAVVGARLKQGFYREHHGKSETGKRAPPGFGAVAAVVAPGQALRGWPHVHCCAGALMAARATLVPDRRILEPNPEAQQVGPVCGSRPRAPRRSRCGVDHLSVQCPSVLLELEPGTSYWLGTVLPFTPAAPHHYT